MSYIPPRTSMHLIIQRQFLYIYILCMFCTYCGRNNMSWVVLSLFFKRRFQDVAINTVTIVISCLISSYISTMMHGLIDIITIFPIFINGCIAAVLYLKSNSILIPIIFHVVINLLAWIAML